jgi:hypothetical protein
MTPEHHAARRAIVVLGMHRSGTSAMTRILSLAGAQLPARLMEAGPDNAEGFWESLAVADFNDEVLRAFDTEWDDTFGPRRRAGRALPMDRFVPRAREILRNEYGDAELLVIKEPRLNLLLDLWQMAFKEEGIQEHYVIMVRRPDEIVRSLATRNHIERHRGLLLWANYMTSAEIGTRFRPRVFVKFDALFADHEDVLDRLEGELSVDLPRRAQISGAEMEEFLRPDLKHHNNTGPLRFPSALQPLRELHEYLDAAADGRPRNDDIPGKLAAWLQGLEGAVGPIIAKARYQLANAEAEERTSRDRLQAALAESDGQQAKVVELEATLARSREEAHALKAHVADLEQTLISIEQSIAWNLVTRILGVQRRLGLGPFLIHFGARGRSIRGEGAHVECSRSDRKVALARRVSSLFRLG